MDQIKPIPTPSIGLQQRLTEKESMMFELALSREREEEPAACEGRFFRYRRNEYFTGDQYGVRETFKLLKRKSCPGCEQCDWMYDFMKEEFSADSGAQLPPNLVDQDICEMKVVSTSTDWESGLVDEIIVGFVKVGNAFD